MINSGSSPSRLADVSVRLHFRDLLFYEQIFLQGVSTNHGFFILDTYASHPAERSFSILRAHLPHYHHCTP
jgi:hypothetical protein